MVLGCLLGSGRAPVGMVEPAKHGLRVERRGEDAGRRRSGQRQWRLPFDALVRPRRIVVAVNVLGQRLLKVPRVEGNEVIEQLAA